MLNTKTMLTESVQRLVEDILSEIDSRIAGATVDRVNPTKSDDLLTCKEVEDYFDITPPTRKSWTDRGILRAYAVGSRKYYKRSEVENAPVPIRYHVAKY